uniref:Uncharacterized protein n=1 Tax=Coccidioides posadasii RMSCC 3488 TaxID=454284 RepID=A0A0J6FCN5_COCPO|nr:hypothetical protein CPAG_04365 [Coccidioides posadasii RMSCC 3488]
MALRPPTFCPFARNIAVTEAATPTCSLVSKRVCCTQLTGQLWSASGEELQLAAAGCLAVWLAGELGAWLSGTPSPSRCILVQRHLAVKRQILPACQHGADCCAQDVRTWLEAPRYQDQAELTLEEVISASWTRGQQSTS